MKLIYTNDGLIGLTIQGKTIWVNNQQEALAIMWSIFGKRNTFTKEEIQADLAYAINHCAKTGDDVIEFGVLGSFMYTTRTESPDQDL